MPEILSLYDEEGNVIDEKEFIERAKELYKTATSDDIKGVDIDRLKVTTNPDTQINAAAAYETFNFLDRRFYINGEISHETALLAHEFISYWNEIDTSEDVIPLVIFINSPGGDLDATFSIIDSIQGSNIPVYTINIGRAWSGAFLVLLAGEKRYGTTYSSYLFHEGSCGYSQDAHKIMQYTDFYQQMLKHMKSFILARTSITTAQYDEHQKDDWWLNSSDAIKYGIINNLYTKGVEIE